MITWAALATADRAASGTESSAARNACATGFAPRGARVVAAVVSVLAILVVAPFQPSGLVACTRRSRRNDAPDFGRTRSITSGCIGTRSQKLGYAFADRDCCIEPPSCRGYPAN